jgi:hypothetical protein
MTSRDVTKTVCPTSLRIRKTTRKRTTPKKTNHPSAATASKGHAYNGENSGYEKTAEKGAGIRERVAKLQKSGLNIEQINRSRPGQMPTLGFERVEENSIEYPSDNESESTSEISDAGMSAKHLRYLNRLKRNLEIKKKEQCRLEEDMLNETCSKNFSKKKYAELEKHVKTVDANIQLTGEKISYWTQRLRGNHVAGLAARFERHLRQ